MKILNVEHRDIHITVDFSYKQLKQLRDFLSHADVKYNSEKEPDMLDVDKYVTEFLYPFLSEFINNLENEQG